MSEILTQEEINVLLDSITKVEYNPDPATRGIKGDQRYAMTYALQRDIEALAKIVVQDTDRAEVHSICRTVINSLLESIYGIETWVVFRDELTSIKKEAPNADI